MIWEFEWDVMLELDLEWRLWWFSGIGLLETFEWFDLSDTRECEVKTDEFKFNPSIWDETNTEENYWTYASPCPCNTLLDCWSYNLDNFDKEWELLPIFSKPWEETDVFSTPFFYFKRLILVGVRSWTLL